MSKVKQSRFAAVLLAFVLAAGSLLALAGCSAGSSGAGGDTLRVGVRGDIVGFGYLNEDTGKYYGLEIDIAEEMAQRMGYGDVEFTTVLPETRKEMLQNGEVDCLVACYSITDTRIENFDFSPAYYTDFAKALVMETSLIESIDDMRGLTFGAMAGSNTAPLLVKKLVADGFTTGEVLEGADGTEFARYDGFTLVQYPSYQELSGALEEGLVDAACMDGSIASAFMADDRHFIEGFDITEQNYGVATAKGSELSGQVAEAIQSMLDDGTIASMIDKWN